MFKTSYRFAVNKALLSILMWGIPIVAFAEEHLELIIKTQAGEQAVIIDLFDELAPQHVERIKTLAKSGQYNKVAFHRVIAGFMAQTGDIEFGKMSTYNDSRVGSGGSKLPDLPAEFSERPFEVGTVGMARSRNPNSANSQFFITTQAAPHLNGQYTVFGEVIKGMDAVQKIKLGNARKNGSVKNPDFIVKASLIDAAK